MVNVGTVRTLAETAREWLKRSGDSAPGWVGDLSFVVHRDAAGQLIPDACTYDILYWVLGAFQEADTLEGAVDAVVETSGVYTEDLLRWLANCPASIGYVDEWRKENGCGNSVLDDIVGGLRYMVEAVASVAFRFLEKKAGVFHDGEEYGCDKDGLVI